jgi:pectinesterase
MNFGVIALLSFYMFSWNTLAAETLYHMTVAQDGSGDFTTIQAAIDATKTFPDKAITIEIKNGNYQEKVHVYEWNPRLNLIGESSEHTIISFDDHFDKISRGRNSTFHTATLQVDGNDFHAQNLTIRNTAGPVGQAIAVAVTADRASFYQSRFLGNQDTLYVSGESTHQYFKDCYIEGTTDFIFGNATAVFDNCEIKSLSNSFVTAASTTDYREFGLVFLNSRLTAKEGVNHVYLGRPWRTFAKTAFINSYLGPHIAPEGWDDWNNAQAQTQSLYAEFNNSGPGAKLEKRVKWAHVLSTEQAKQYQLSTILNSTTHPFWYRK